MTTKVETINLDCELAELTEEQVIEARRKFYEIAHGEPTFTGYNGEIEREKAAQKQREADQDYLER